MSINYPFYLTKSIFILKVYAVGIWICYVKHFYQFYFSITHFILLRKMQLTVLTNRYSVKKLNENAYLREK